MFDVFSFPPCVYVGNLNLIASIPGLSVLTLPLFISPSVKHKTAEFANTRYNKHHFLSYR